MKRITLKAIGSTMLATTFMLTIAMPSFADGLPAPKDTAAFELTASKAMKISRVTGASREGETVPNPNETHTHYALTATDLGIMWDATSDNGSKKVMVAFGDSYDDGWGGFGGGGNGAGWRSNLLAISEDAELSDGLTFSSMIMNENKAGYSKEIISSAHNTSGSGDFTAIPTAGVTVGTRHYIHYMQIKNWGANGRWNTNFSEIAYSDDEGQNWTKSGAKWGATSKFAQAAYVKDDGYVYMFGTPAGRFDSAYLARAADQDMLLKEQYEYWNGTGWSKNNEAAAVAVVDAPVSELSVVYNSYYDKWIMTYLNENQYAIVMRSSSSLTEGWSDETEIVTGAEYPGLYGGFIHPWTNDGQDLYMLMSEWGPYNVFLMHAKLDVGTPDHNLIADPSFEKQASGTISAPWTLEEGKGGIDRATLSRAGSNNVWLRNSAGWNAIAQVVDVEANTEYLLTGFVKTSQNNNAGYFGVRDSAGGILKETKFERFDNYSKLSVRFNSGSNTQVKIFTGMHTNGDTWIQADDYSLLPVDTAPPVITLLGGAAVEVPLGGAFTDEGASAVDSKDGDLSHKIVVEGSVDQSIIGTYPLSYKVSDSDGNAAVPVIRTVKVTGAEYSVSGVSFKDADGKVIRKLPKKGFVTASANVRNNTGAAKTITLVAALYNKKGEVENVSGVTKSLVSGAEETFIGGFKMPGNNSGYILKVFIANSLNDLQSISDVAILN
ncbi:DUF4185 domain-containing protein [Paenibacillus sp. PL91]|uniref:DUF4185 domain-containing protein n=1 Tax=Paenibacillus sp. PL91 TaxID=2729538 RepID=UPI00145D0C1A|nr:DUF4185 domain-containing protein [Paenibacillus sp. PL91]MBC9200676.1 DUF4185 domain-containing protein [Paenibacillus sp. PL91]